MLYPDDRTYEGKELRLKQQHFFVSATVQVRVCVGWGWGVMQGGVAILVGVRGCITCQELMCMQAHTNHSICTGKHMPAACVLTALPHFKQPHPSCCAVHRITPCMCICACAGRCAPLHRDPRHLGPVW